MSTSNRPLNQPLNPQQPQNFFQQPSFSQNVNNNNNQHREGQQNGPLANYNMGNHPQVVENTNLARGIQPNPPQQFQNTTQNKPLNQNTPSVQQTPPANQSGKNCTLVTYYALSFIITLTGAAISLTVILLANDLFGSLMDASFIQPSSMWASFNFILIYMPFAGILCFPLFYLILQARKNQGRDINHSQTVSLVLAFLVMVFGICNFTQYDSSAIKSCSQTSTLCDYTNLQQAYYYMVIEAGVLPFLFLCYTQYALGKIKKQPTNVQVPINNQTFNNIIPQVQMVEQPLPSRILEQCNTPTDHMGMPIFEFGETRAPANGQALDNQSQMTYNKSKISGHSNNFGGIGPSQIDIETQDVSLRNMPNNQFANNLSEFNQNQIKTTSSHYQATPQKNNNGFNNNSGFNNNNNNNNGFSNNNNNGIINNNNNNVSPITKLTQQNANNNNNNNQNNNQFNNNNNNQTSSEYNPFGKVQNGEIQLGKHPYLANTDDPNVGKKLDQVHQMVNSQVKTLIVDLKKQNKI